MQKQPLFPLEPTKIAAAFDIIRNSNNSKDLIKEADIYIRQCQSNHEFALTLMVMFSQANDTNQKWQILIHLSNVIKRNWTTKRRSVHEAAMKQDLKTKVKDGLIELYTSHWQMYYKEFNQIFKFLSRAEFPTNYPSLKKFILQILSGLSKADIQSLINLNQLLPYLSLVKTVFKQYSTRKLGHNRQLYYQHVAEAVMISSIIFQKINSAIIMIKQAKDNYQEGGNNNFNFQISNRLLECSRKIDKIILYCLQCAVSTMQNDIEISKIVHALVNKIQILLSLRVDLLNQQIQLNLYAILQGVSKLQASFPFVFTSFLSMYLKTILNLLISQKFQNQNLTNCIITSNTKPLVTYSYYSSQQKFRQTIQSRQGGTFNYQNDQKICHSVFIDLYGGSNTMAFMQKAIMDLLPKYKNAHDFQSDVIFQQSQNPDSFSQYGSFQLLLILLKNLMLRFKQQLKPFVIKIISHLIQNNCSSNSNTVSKNMYEVILLLPKVYDETNLHIDKIFNLMQICYNSNDFTMFSRLIKNYNSYFNDSIIRKSFQILVNMVAKSNVDHQVLFQCAVSIKKILSQHQEQGLPVQKLGSCLINLLNLVAIYKGTPTHLWNLLQLVNEILKLISNEAVFVNLHGMVSSINSLIESNNDELVVNAISDMLQNILQLTSIDQSTNNSAILQNLYQISINLIGRNINNKKIQSPQTLYKLWLCVARSVHTSQCSAQFNNKFTNALHSMKDKIYEQDPVLYVQLVEQYLLGNFLNINEHNLLQIYSQAMDLISDQSPNRLLMAYYSLYFTYYNLTKNYIPKLIFLAMQQLMKLHNKISQQNNILRTFLMLIINHHMIQIGSQKIFELFNQSFNNDYKAWFGPYIWSLQYLGHKYASKVASIAMLYTLDLLQNANILFTPIQEYSPFQKILKAVSLQVQPINSFTAATSYMNSLKLMMQGNDKSTRPKIGYLNTKIVPRKYKLQIKNQWSQSDLVKPFQQKFCAIFNTIGWNLETIEQKFDKMNSTRIISILTKSENN